MKKNGQCLFYQLRLAELLAIWSGNRLLATFDRRLVVYAVSDGKASLHLIA